MALATLSAAFLLTSGPARFSPAAALSASALQPHARVHRSSHAAAANDDEEERTFRIGGTVKSIDYDANVIELSSRGGSVSVVVTPTTAIEAHGDVAGIADIRRGSKITVSGVIRGGKMVARSIVVR